MRLLDRYLLRELVVPLVFCLGGFLVIWVAFDLIGERMGLLQDAKLTFAQVILYYIYELPNLLEIVLPVGLLLGLLWALTTHAKAHELTAIRAAGVSVWRLALPYLAVGLGFTLLEFAVNEFWQPHGAVAAEQLLLRHKGSPLAKGEADFKKAYFRNTRDARFWALDFNQLTYQMRNIAVDSVMPDGSRRVFAAESGFRSNGVWYFYNVRQHTDLPNQNLPSDRIITNFTGMPEFTETPADIKSEIRITEQLSHWKQDRAELPLIEILRYLERHPSLQGQDRAKLYTKFYGRLATPWRCLVVVLIALPFGAASGRRNIFVGVASGIFICFAYVILLQFGLAVGAGGYLPPWLAAWLPNILFGGASIIAIFRLR